MSDIQCAARFLIARHAEGAGAAEAGLSDRGTVQARELADALRAERVAGVFSPESGPARLTARTVAAGLSSTAEELPDLPDLHQLQVGELPAAASTMADAGLGAPAAWFQGNLETRLPDGATGLEIAGRFAAAIQECADSYRGETVLVISDGLVMAVALTQLARRLDLLAAPWIPYCGLARVDVDADGWALQRWPGAADTADEPG